MSKKEAKHNIILKLSAKSKEPYPTFSKQFHVFRLPYGYNLRTTQSDF